MSRKRRSSGGGGPSWLDTYADMVTLLLTFFVLLFSISTVDSSKWKAIAEAFGGRAGGTQGPVAGGLPEESGLVPEQEIPDIKDIKELTDIREFDDLYYYFKSYVSTNRIDDTIGVYKGDAYTFIIFQNSIFFDGDSAVLRGDGKALLDLLANGIAQIPDQIGEIRVYGHTANTGIASPLPDRIRVEDRRLSTERANNVLLYIDLKNIIASGKMVAEGYGEYRPLVPHDNTEKTRRKNRRVELYIAKNGATAVLLDDIYKEVRKADEGAAS